MFRAVAQAWGDYSGDGKLDLAIGYAAGRVRLFRSNGNGSFAEDPEIMFVANTWNSNSVIVSSTPIWCRW